MGIELEAKMRVDDHEPLRERLALGGAKRIGAVLETNTFFDDSEQRLLHADSGLRLRQIQDAHASQTRYVITFKGPGRDSELKAREEIEISVKPGSDAAALLIRLGFPPTLSFEKRRETWELDDCLIELDELPQLGLFVEIEGPDEEAIMSVRDALELANRPLVKTSYSAMVAELLGNEPSRTGEMHALRF